MTAALSGVLGCGVAEPHAPLAPEGLKTAADEASASGKKDLRAHSAPSLGTEPGQTKDNQKATLASLAARIDSIAREAQRRCGAGPASEAEGADCALAADALVRARTVADKMKGLSGDGQPGSPAELSGPAAEAHQLWQHPGQDGAWVRVGQALAAATREGGQLLASPPTDHAAKMSVDEARAALAALDSSLGGQVFQRPGALPAGGVAASDIEGVRAHSAAKRQRYHFTNSWFDGLRPGWEEATLALRGRPLDILEIGAFEGGATTWMLDELAAHPEARLTAVDTFGGSMEHQPGAGGDYALSSLRQRFDDNVARSDHADRLRVMAMTSQDALHVLYDEAARFDFIYIDASHTASGVLADAVEAWPLLKVGGTLVFDDFEWQHYVQDIYNPRKGITAFLECYAAELRYAPRHGQIWAFRTANAVVPTPR